MRRILGTWRSLKTRSARPTSPAHFVLQYSQAGDSVPVTVGHLRYDGASTWTFAYDAEYKRRGDLRPIEGFDDVDRLYRSTTLFPFFAVRVPDLARLDVRRKLDADHIAEPDVTDLLRIFGRRAVSSPGFELLPA